jgi:DNA-binding transcriptional regulator YiaG
MLQVGRTNADGASGELFHAGLYGVWATDSVGERMAMTELRLLLEDRSMSSPEEMRTWRESLGLDVNAVAGALLLSTAQVRDLESGSTRAFYNEGFYQRAKMKYVALLRTYPVRIRPLPEQAMPDGSSAPRITLAEPKDS